MEGFQRWLVQVSSCCPFEISLGQSEPSVLLIIKKPFKSSSMGRDRERMSLYAMARAAALAVQECWWCLEVSQGFEVCTPYWFFQVLAGLWDLGSIFPVVRSSPKV